MLISIMIWKCQRSSVPPWLENDTWYCAAQRRRGPRSSELCAETPPLHSYEPEQFFFGKKRVLLWMIYEHLLNPFWAIMANIVWANWTKNTSICPQKEASGNIEPNQLCWAVFESPELKLLKVAASHSGTNNAGVIFYQNSDHFPRSPGTIRFKKNWIPGAL